MHRMELDTAGVRLGDTFLCDCGIVHEAHTRAIYLGEGLEDLLGEALKDREIKGPVLLVTGGSKTRLVAGLAVERYFRSLGVSTVTVEARRADIYTVSEIEAEAARCVLAVAVGGGTAIDACKYAAHMAGIPFISVPTSISHDGIASPIASIMIGRRRTSMVTTPPTIVLIQVDIVAGSPRRLLSSGCADIIAKTTALRDWMLGRRVKGEYFCVNAFSLAASALRDVTRYIDSGMSDVSILASAAVKCGLSMTLMRSSRPCSGAEHLFAHYLDASGGCAGLHGEKVGIGAILAAKRYEDIDEPATHDIELSAEKVRAYLARAGAPISIRDIGVSVDKAVEALIHCKSIRPERYTILHHAPLTLRGAQDLLQRAGVR